MIPCLVSLATSLCCSCCSWTTVEILRSSARVAYSTLFLFSMILAWLLRDFHGFIKHFVHPPKDVPYLPPDVWWGEQAVFRLSMGNFLLFAVLALVMSFPAPVVMRDDWRDSKLHHGGWVVKVLLWLGFNILPFFFSNGVITVYATVSKVVSPLFLAIQTLIIIDLTQEWNDRWVVEGDSDERYLYALLIGTIGNYVLTVALFVASFMWFSPGDIDADGVPIDCSFNWSMIMIGVLLCTIMTMFTLHPSIKEASPRASVFVASSMAMYVAYLGFSALQSEPRDYACNSLGKQISAASGTTLAMGMVITLASTVWAAFRAGSNTHTFEYFDRDVEREYQTLRSAPHEPDMDRGHGQRDEEDARDSSVQPVSYSYVQFYLIFALASMYVGMLMTGWGDGKMQKDMIDIGWPSVYVKLACSWLSAGVYVWTLCAPMVLIDRTF